MGWLDHFKHHQERAAIIAERHHQEHEEAIGVAIVTSILAVAAGTIGIVRELRKLRHTLETQAIAITDFHLVAHVVPKEGVPLMSNSAGPINPTDLENVQITIDPKNTLQQPVSDPALVWASSDGTLALQVSDDKKSCLVVTATGALDGIVSVTQPSTGLSATVAISRVAPPPPDLAISDFGISASAVAK